MTATHDEALDLHASLCQELCFTMDFEPGDLQLLNNQLRLWLAASNSRALPPSYLPIWGSIASGVVHPVTLLS